MKPVTIVSLLLVIVGFAAIRWANRSKTPRQTIRTLVGGLVSINGLVVLLALGMMILTLGNPLTVLAQTTTTAASSDPSMGAALATGLACIGAGIAVGISGAAAIGGITEKPEILGRSLIFVGLAEGIAIYGLIISFMILSR
ncbi:MAG: ATP synthase subunit C [Chloroflexi bacterium]|nr:ATP synthase subunit C [Chloroflexota bacterium]